jgi:hypothetical protein
MIIYVKMIFRNYLINSVTNWLLTDIQYTVLKITKDQQLYKIKKTVYLIYEKSHIDFIGTVTWKFRRC